MSGKLSGMMGAGGVEERQGKAKHEINHSFCALQQKKKHFKHESKFLFQIILWKVNENGRRESDKKKALKV